MVGKGQSYDCSKFGVYLALGKVADNLGGSK